MTLPDFLAYLKSRNASRTWVEVGAELGVSGVCVQRWIAGKRKPSPSVLLLAEKMQSELTQSQEL